ncbi:hypothetical protein SAMN04488032_10461 [Pacificibacter marinus]|uniref:Uncharacterized protein n=2 Tax=Pacificibacter marinus TaxID=658057 RepID=A0A1Y5SKM2_9RHOB|nr:hypothetical protein SAMN04488032_10461 [Pacificibacter marinus]SLN42383.1 hypothetical protein PAM7971_02016 [Pacificibacter marinus]
MPPKDYMPKHKGFPSRFPGSDFQFTIRRANPKGVTPIKALERFKDRKSVDKRVDTAFITTLWNYFGEEPFERGNLDAGRLSWFWGREVVPADPDNFDPASYEALIKINVKIAQVTFPELFVADDPFEDDAENDEDDR